MLDEPIEFHCISNRENKAKGKIMNAFERIARSTKKAVVAEDEIGQIA